MNVEEYKRSLIEVTNRVNTQEWVINHLLKDVDKLVNLPNISSNHKVGLHKDLSGLRYLPEFISSMIDKDKTPLDNLDYIIKNVDSNEIEKWFNSSSKSKCMEDLVVSVLKSEWRNEELKYQVIIPTNHSTTIPYLYKDDSGSVLLKNSKRNDKNLVTEVDNTLLTERDIINTGLLEYKEEYNPEETNKHWLAKRIKRIFNLTSSTDWVVSKLLNDLKVVDVKKLSKTTEITQSANNELPMEIVKGLSVLGELTEYDKYASSENTYREDLSNLVHHAKYELVDSAEWISNVDNQVDMLTSWLTWNWKIEPNKYQFYFDVPDENGNLTYLYKPKKRFSKLKYKALSSSDAKNNPQTVFTKEQLEKEKDFAHMWDFRKRVN